MTRLEQKVLDVAKVVHRAFARRGAPEWLLEDVAQDAALGALEAERSGRVDDRWNAWSYLSRAARCTAGLALSRATAVVSISEHEAVNARDYQGRVTSAVGDEGDEVDIGEVLPSGLPSPLEVLAGKQAHATSTARRLRRNRLLETWIADLEEGDARAVSMLLGLRGEEAAAGGVDEVAFRTGLGRTVVLRSVQRIKARARRDGELRRAQRLMEEVET